MHRIGVFVDTGNQYYAVSHAYKDGKINYQKYMQICKEKGDVVVAQAFVVSKASTGIGFINCLERAGFDVIHKITDGIVKYNWNLSLCVAAIEHMDLIDTYIIGTATSHLTPLVKFLRSRDKSVIIFAADAQPHLLAYATGAIEFTEALLE